MNNEYTQSKRFEHFCVHGCLNWPRCLFDSLFHRKRVRHIDRVMGQGLIIERIDN